MTDFHRLLTDRTDWGPLATFVPNKRLPIYNWFYFKEGFARDLVVRLLDQWQPRGTVVDPYCGSGTTLLACRERGLESLGTDQLPISLLASRVKAAVWEPDRLREAVAEVFSRRFERLQVPFPFARYFNRHVLEDVFLFKDQVERLPQPAKDFFLLALITSAVRASWLWKDGTVLKVKKHPVPPFRKFFRHQVNRMIKDAERFPARAAARVEAADPWNLPVEDRSVGAVITSPPYLHQIDYSRVYAVENWFAGGGAGPAAYLGEEAEPRYFADLDRVLAELARACRPGAMIGVVVGNAYFPGRIVEVDLRLAEATEAAGFAVKEIAVLNKRHALEHRTIQAGILRESLVIAERER